MEVLQGHIRGHLATGRTWSHLLPGTLLLLGRGHPLWRRGILPGIQANLLIKHPINVEIRISWVRYRRLLRYITAWQWLVMRLNHDAEGTNSLRKQARLKLELKFSGWIDRLLRGAKASSKSNSKSNSQLWFSWQTATFTTGAN